MEYHQYLTDEQLIDLYNMLELEKDMEELEREDNKREYILSTIKNVLA